MKTYARILDDKVVEIIQPYAGPDGIEVPVEDRFTPELVATMVDITGVTPQPVEHWTYVDGIFEPPSVYQPTPEEIIVINQRIQFNLLNNAAQSMAPVLVSLQLGDATDGETLIAKEWQSYWRDLKLVDLTVTNPEWPTPPSGT